MKKKISVSTRLSIIMWPLKQLAPQKIISSQLGCLEEPSMGLMMLITSAMRACPLYQGFSDGLTQGSRLRAQAFPHSCGMTSKYTQVWETHLAAGDQSVSQTWRGACPVTPLPCCHLSSAKEPWQEHLHIQGCDGWLALSLSLTGTGSWRHQQTTYRT